MSREKYEALHAYIRERGGPDADALLDDLDRVAAGHGLELIRD